MVCEQLCPCRHLDFVVCLTNGQMVLEVAVGRLITVPCTANLQLAGSYVMYHYVLQVKVQSQALHCHVMRAGEERAVAFAEYCRFGCESDQKPCDLYACVGQYN